MRKATKKQRRHPLKNPWVAVPTAAAVIFFLAMTILLYSSAGPAIGPGIVDEKTFESAADLIYSYEITRYPSTATVIGTVPSSDLLTIGVAIDVDSLKFGSIPAGGSFGKRTLTLANLRDQPAKIYVGARGTIADQLEFSKRDVVLRPGENVSVEVTFKTDGANVGDYSGEIDVVVKRTDIEFFRAFW